MERVLLPTSALLVVGCASIAGLDDVTASAPGGDDCQGSFASPADEGVEHAPDGSPLTWIANPPASGTHYDNWAKWERSYGTPIPRGYWVHNAEHGGIVFLHNCTNCNEDIDRIAAFMMEMSADPQCGPPIKRRWMITPDPMLPAGVEFAAIAWRFAYTATCFNEDELRMFAEQRYGGGPEPLQCDQGSFPP